MHAHQASTPNAITAEGLGVRPTTVHEHTFALTRAARLLSTRRSGMHDRLGWALAQALTAGVWV